jgi:hypothetical protein
VFALWYVYGVVQVSAHGMALAEGLALRVGQQGGAALIIDYGKDGPYADSLMAIQAHKGVGVSVRTSRNVSHAPLPRRVSCVLWLVPDQDLR